MDIYGSIILKLKDILVMQNKITWVKSISIGEGEEDTYGHFKPINSERYINVTNEDIYHFTKKDNTKINREAVGVPYKWKCNLIDRKTGKHRINKKTGLPVEDKKGVKVIVGLFPMILLLLRKKEENIQQLFQKDLLNIVSKYQM